MDNEEMNWIYSQIFKEILSEVKEDQRSKVKEYCKHLYIDENTFDLIATKRDLVEEYYCLRAMVNDSNPLFALANLMLDKKDYDRAEHFYLEALRSEEQNWSRQVQILNKLSEVSTNKNQPEKVQQYREQANKIKQQNS